MFYVKTVLEDDGNLKTILNAQFLRFVFVGIVNTLFGTFVMFGLYNYFHCSYFFSTAMNYILGSILSFFLNKYFTFQNKNKSVKQILIFIFNIVICYSLAYSIAKPIANFTLVSFSKSIQDNVSMLIGMILFTILNYFGQKFLVFACK